MTFSHSDKALHDPGRDVGTELSFSRAATPDCPPTSAIEEVFQKCLVQQVEDVVLPRFREILREELHDAGLQKVSTNQKTIRRQNAGMHGTSSQVPPRRSRSATLRELDNSSESERNAMSLLERKLKQLKGIEPDGIFSRFWTYVCLLIVLVDVFLVTFEWSFLPNSLSGHGLVKVFEIGSSIIWILDLFICFSTGYFDSSIGKAVLSQPAICKRYLKGWFWCDLLATIPALLGLIASEVSSMRFLSLVRLLKLMRLFRIIKLAVLFETKSLGMMMTITKWLIVLLFTAHFVACILWRLSSIVDDDKHLVDTTTHTGSKFADVFPNYITALHLSMSLLTGMGLGTHTTTSQGEMLALIVFYLLSLPLLGLIVNEVTHVYAMLNEKKALIKHKLLEFSAMMKWCGAPIQFQKKAEKYMSTVLVSEARKEFLGKVRSSLKHASSLSDDLNLIIFESSLLAHQQLKTLPIEMRALISSLCEIIFFLPKEMISRQCEKPTKMFFMRKGTAEITFGKLCEEEEFCQLKPGELLFSRELLLPYNGCNDCNCVCETFCELSGLQFDLFHARLSAHNPAALYSLQIQAAADLDSVEDMSLVLENRTCENPLPDAGSELHICARAGATSCVAWLVSNADADLNAKDLRGQTPLEVAQSVHRHDAVDALLMAGAKVDAVVPRDSAVSSLQASEMERWLAQSSSPINHTQMLQILDQNHISYSGWGLGHFKSTFDLASEVQAGVSKLSLDSSANGLLRVVAVVRVKLFATCTDAVKVLYETERPAWLDSGGDVVRLPSSQMKVDHIDEALTYIWEVVLGFDRSFVQNNLERGETTISHEFKQSASYPGLPTAYLYHTIDFWVRDPTCSECEEIGLPSGERFSVITFNNTPGGCAKPRVFMWLQASKPSDLFWI